MSFGAAGRDRAVELTWQTGSELSNVGFRLYRARSAAGPYERITSAVIPGLGSSPVGASYSYRDSGLANGTEYFYKLEDIEATGKTEMHGPVSATPTADSSDHEGDGSGDGSAGSSDGSGGDGASGAFGDEESDNDGTPRARIAYGDPNAVSLQVLERSAQHAVIELVTPGFYAIAEEGGVRIEIPGFDEAAAGLLALPFKRALVEAPAGRQVRLDSVTPSETVAFDGMKPLVQGTLELVVGRGGTVRTKRRPFRAVSRLLAEGQGGRSLDDSVRLNGTRFQGEVKKVELELRPMSWDGRRLQLVKRLRVRVSFVGVEASEQSLGGTKGRRRGKGAARRSAVLLAQLRVAESGLYRVGFEEVFDLAPQVNSVARARRRGVLAADVRLSRLGQPVPFHVEPASTTFGPGSSLYFYSSGSPANAYGDAVYEIELGTGGALRMPTASAAPAGRAVTECVSRVTFEQNKFYQAGLLDATELWLWDLVISPATKSYPFTLPHLVASSASAARLSVALQGATDLETSPTTRSRCPSTAARWARGAGTTRRRTRSTSRSERPACRRDRTSSRCTTPAARAGRTRWCSSTASR